MTTEEFEVLCDKHHIAWLRVITGMIRREHSALDSLAEDVLHDFFVSTLDGLPSEELANTFETLAHKRLIWRTKDALRKVRARKEIPLVYYDSDEMLRDWEESVEPEYDVELDVKAAITKLQVDDRVYAEYMLLEDGTVEDMAKEFSIPTRTMYRKWNQIKARLQVLLAAYEPRKVTT